MKHLHILGICGTFMGGVAVLARQLGFKVTGCDQNVYPPMSDTLRSAGIEVLNGYDPKHLQPHPDAVIVGNAMSRGNPAVEYMLNNNIPYISGPRWISENILKYRHVLAVSGTHGKTTTSSMLTWILMHAGLNPGYLIGGVANNFDHTAHLGEQPYFVIEADEYDSAFFDKRSKFLHYRSRTLIINNLEFDHGDIFSDLDAIKTQFQYLLRTVPGEGLIITPEKDENIDSVIARGCWTQRQTFSRSSADWSYEKLQDDASEFSVFYQGKQCGVVNWAMLGEYNIENGLAAIAAANNIGIAPEKSIAALCEFTGNKRRLELRGEVNDISVFDDFAHHPTAIEKTLKALRQKVGQQKIVAVLQFGSNTMRRGLHKQGDIVKALSNADHVVMLRPEESAMDIDALCHDCNVDKIEAFDNVDTIIKSLTAGLKPHDQVLVMSNKGFSGIHEKLLSALAHR